MGSENIRLSKYNNGTYIISEQYLGDKRFYGYNNAYNYADKIIVYKKSDNEYFFRYHDVDIMNYVPLQLKI